MGALEWVELGLFALGVLVTIIGAMAMIIFRQISDDIRRMADGVSDLNVKVAVIFEKNDSHDKRLVRLESLVQH